MIKLTNYINPGEKCQVERGEPKLRYAGPGQQTSSTQIIKEGKRRPLITQHDNSCFCSFSCQYIIVSSSVHRSGKSVTIDRRKATIILHKVLFIALRMTEAETPRESQTEEIISYDHIPRPFRPSPGINYDFIVSMYLGGCGLAVLFFALEKQLLSPLLEGDIEQEDIDNSTEGGEEEKDVDPWKEFAKGMQGMYFVFAPFLLCLPWSLIVRHFWMRETKMASSTNKKED